MEKAKTKVEQNVSRQLENMWIEHKNEKNTKYAETSKNHYTGKCSIHGITNLKIPNWLCFSTCQF